MATGAKQQKTIIEGVSIHVCEPEWHKGKRVAADYMLKQYEENPTYRTKAFATCAKHLPLALEVMGSNPMYVRWLGAKP
jgi:hypothetical protein